MTTNASAVMASVWIPAVSGLVGVAIGGALGYLTVWQQLRHASREAKLAREHTLKREVYFEAAEGLAGAVKLLGSWARLDETVQHLSEISAPDQGWAYKVHAVGNLETIKALDRAAEFLFSACFDLMPMRLSLDTLRDEARQAEERRTRTSAHAQQLVAALQAVSAPDATPEARAYAPQVAQNLLAAHADLVALAAEWKQAVSCQHRAHRDLLVASMKALAGHQRFLSEANVNIRRELGLAFDEEDYLSHMEESSRTILARLEEALDQLGIE